jgi:hypothetical protein
MERTRGARLGGCRARRRVAPRPLANQDPHRSRDRRLHTPHIPEAQKCQQGHRPVLPRGRIAPRRANTRPLRKARPTGDPLAAEGGGRGGRPPPPPPPYLRPRESRPPHGELQARSARRHHRAAGPAAPGRLDRARHQRRHTRHHPPRPRAPHLPTAAASGHGRSGCLTRGVRRAPPQSAAPARATLPSAARRPQVLRHRCALPRPTNVGQTFFLFLPLNTFNFRCFC